MSKTFFNFKEWRFGYLVQTYFKSRDQASPSYAGRSYEGGMSNHTFFASDIVYIL